MNKRMFAVAAIFAAVSAAPAAPIAQLGAPPSSLLLVDWQTPQQLPPRLRNHCGYDAISGRLYCSDHCGFDYQVYACSRHSFGCCRPGFGYCDWNGLLRCHP
jgi:hypothetical protein